MITREYHGEDYSNTNTYFIVAKSEKQMNKEMDDFIKEHGTDENMIYVYVNPVRPSKVNLRPEYSMELNIYNKDERLILVGWSRRVW